MNRGHFYKWVEQFKNDQTSVAAKHCSGSPVSIPMLEIRIDIFIQED